MMVKQSFFATLFVLLGASLFLASCSEDDPSGLDSFSIKVPGIGSFFVFNDYDSIDGVKIDSTEQTVRADVLATGISFEGKSDVVQIREVEGGIDDTTIVHLQYKANNDIDLWFDFEQDLDIEGIESGWVNLPFGTEQSQTIVLVDTTETDSTGAEIATLKIELTNSYVGEGSVQVGSEQFSTRIVRTRIVSDINFGGLITANVDSYSDLHLSPDLGFVIRIERESTTEDSDGTEVVDGLRELLSYLVFE